MAPNLGYSPRPVGVRGAAGRCGPLVCTWDVHACFVLDTFIGLDLKVGRGVSHLLSRYFGGEGRNLPYGAGAGDGERMALKAPAPSMVTTSLKPVVSKDLARDARVCRVARVMQPYLDAIA